MNSDSKAKHTAGTWHCATNDYGYLTSVRNSDDTRKICVSRVNNIVESNANMRLIAASPEMYEAIQEFCDRVERGEVRSRRTYAKFKELIKKIEQ